MTKRSKVRKFRSKKNSIFTKTKIYADQKLVMMYSNSGSAEAQRSNRNAENERYRKK